MNEKQWANRQGILRSIAIENLSAVINGTASEDQKAALNNLLQALLAILPMITPRVFDAATRNSEINSLIREDYNQQRSVMLLDWSEATIEIKKLSLERDELLNLKKYTEAIEVQKIIQSLEQDLYDWILSKTIKN